MKKLPCVYEILIILVMYVNSCTLRDKPRLSQQVSIPHTGKQATRPTIRNTTKVHRYARLKIVCNIK